MTCADYQAWHAAIIFGAEMIVVIALLALAVYWDRRRR
jgi:hypothetical protein